MRSGKTKLGVVVGTRGFFSPALAEEGRKQLVAKLEELGFQPMLLDESATPHGAVETVEDAEKYAAFFNEKRNELDGILISLPNFGDEVGIISIFQKTPLAGIPVLIHAFDDELGKIDMGHRRDSFCGKISVCNAFYYRSIPFTNTSTHTSAVDSDRFRNDLERFGRLCRVVKGLKTARIGAIGARPAPFQTMRYSEKLLQETGITVIPVDMSEIIGAMNRLDAGADAVQKAVAKLREYGTIPSTIPEENISRQGKLYVAVNDWMQANQIDAAGFQCWTSIQENFGCATCATMSMLGNMLIPCSCEVDVCGVVGMYALSLATGNASALLDWNNNYGDELDKCVGIHCSNFPKDFLGTGDIEISNLDILGASLGEDKCFGAIKGKVAAGPMTFARVATDDLHGVVKAYVGDARFTDDPFDTVGAMAVCQVNNLQELMDFICVNGFEHHVAMVRTHCADILDEAFSKYLGWETYRHV
jgi:L-fucose isomerase-like protein